MLSVILIAAVTIVVFCYHYSRWRIYKYVGKIPGPTVFPFIGSAYAIMDFNKLRDTVEKLHLKYGPTMKLWVFWVPLVFVTEPKHLQIILNSPHCLDKEERYHLADDLLGNGIISSPGHIWKHQRKLLNPAFSKKVVRTFFDIFVKHSEILVEQLEKKARNGESFDANEYTSKCALDFICETALGVSVDAQRKTSKLMEMSCRGGEILIMRSLRVWLHLDMVFRRTALGKEFHRVVEYMHAFTEPIINKRCREVRSRQESEMVDENHNKPFLEVLLSLGDNLTPLELRQEVEVFIVAGSDTVNTTTQYALVALGMFKEIQDKVREELADVFGTDNHRKIEIDDLPKLQYLERVIKETLRCYTVLPFIGRSVAKDVDLGDFILPAGSSVIVPIAGTHKNPKVWEDPEKFDPDRFLPHEVANRHPYSFIPFSAGPRICLGKKYAMDACKIMLATILRSYKIGSPMNPKNIRFKVEINSKMIGGANITVEKLMH